MAKKTTKKGSPKSPKTPKAPKAPKAKAEPKMTPRQAVEAFNPKGRTPWQDYCKAQKDGDLGRTLGLNETGLSINLEGDAEAQVKSIDKINDEFERLSTFWEATAAYGRQHYNGDGFLHTNGLTRVSDESLGLLAVQALEQLAQRTVFKDKKVDSAKVNPATAAKVYKAVMSWAKNRPEVLIDNRRKQSLQYVKEVIDGREVANLQPVA